MQGRGIHRVQERVKTLPSHLRALTAADENAPPQPADATTKDAQLSRVARNGMVLVVSPAQPFEARHRPRSYDACGVEAQP